MDIKLRNNLLIIIFLLFVLVTSFGCCYSFVKINMGGPIIIEITPIREDDTSKDNDGIKKVSTDLKGDKIVQNYEVILNGIKNNFSIEYTKSLLDEHTLIKGVMNKKIELANILSENENYFQSNYIDSVYGVNFMSIIKGVDEKHYLALINYSNQKDILKFYLFDDKMKHINSDEEIIVVHPEQFLEVESLEDIWYKDDRLNYINYSQIRAKIENDKIYYLKHIHSGDLLGKLEDRIITISNGKLRYEVKRNFNVVNYSLEC